MPSFPSLSRSPSGRKRALSNAAQPPNPNNYLAPGGNNYVPMNNFYPSPRMVPMPMSPGQPGGYPLPAYPYPMGWPSPQFYPADLMPAAPAFVDPRVTQIHVLLSPPAPNVGHHILYDVRYKPDEVYMESHGHPTRLPEDIADQPATNPVVSKMRLICVDLPWKITVNNPKGITLQNVLDAIHEELHQPLTEGEWWIAADEERERCMEAYKANCADNKEFKRELKDGVKRVDWLAKKTMLMSITRTPYDESFIKQRIPDPKAQGETWVLIMDESR